MADTKRTFSFAFLVLLLGLGNSDAQDLQPVADHHMHIRSEAASEALVKLQKELTGQDIPLLDPTGADQIIEMLNAGGIKKGVLLSLAYFFGAPDIDFPDEYQQVMQENNYASDEASRYPGRLVAFCSVNPLAGYAKKEIKRCSDLPNIAGLKLHLANSNVDLRKKEQADKLKTIFELTAALDMPVLIHLFTRNPEYGEKDASIFVEQILSAVPDLYVQIAHLGSAGAYNETTREVISYFKKAEEQKPEIMDDDLVFDLSATIVNPEIAMARGDTARAKEIEKFNAELAEKVEEMDTGRLLFGTDWIAVSRKPANYADLFRSLPIDSDTLETLFENEAEYLKDMN